MTIDKSTKILLALIAIGLFLNGLNPWLQPVPAKAQAESSLMAIASDVSSIKDEISSFAAEISTVGINTTDISSIRSNLRDIEDGTCRNKMICH